MDQPHRLHPIGTMRLPQGCRRQQATDRPRCLHPVGITRSPQGCQRQQAMD
jgi:hypothetical protein